MLRVLVLCAQGHAWNVGHCAAGLIASGEVPPFIVVAVDSAGPMRSLNYLPYKPGVWATHRDCSCRTAWQLLL